jgi:hypothetical protein
MLDDLPTWLVAIGLLPWWARRVLQLVRDIDRYRAERLHRKIR